MPRKLWAIMEAEKAEAEIKGRLGQTKKEQQLLNFATVTGPKEFTRAETLNAVTKLIATNNQVSCRHGYSNHPYLKENSHPTISLSLLPIMSLFETALYL
jgi:hypothetical protein